ncbi:hypothetical protein AVEN_240043-1 [Araneus ventricosus]|uniref:Protein kinase domain-containing protein n=1 Tax=Araneus ventricosus TaxID=182803 RepID=A0A4Y2ULV3_ARAVE|nr:hypothetical protein AVEN_240043-1 [Araneus ventricosus]
MTSDYPMCTTPPETSRTRRNERRNDGRNFDVWSYGIMTMELLTNFHIARSFPSNHMSTDTRYACMRNGGGGIHRKNANCPDRCGNHSWHNMEETFTEKMQTALPAVEIIHGDILMALDILHSFLRRHPSARMAAEVGMEHSFLRRHPSARMTAEVGMEHSFLRRHPSARMTAEVGMEHSFLRRHPSARMTAEVGMEHSFHRLISTESSEDNNEKILKCLCDAESYIRGMKISRNGPSILNSNRRTGFLGFLVCIKILKQAIHQSHIYGWEVLEHPPYSPDLSPCDFHIFGALKKALQGTRFHSEDAVKEAVQDFLKNQPRSFYSNGIAL